MHDTGILGHLNRTLMEMWEYYTPFGAATIFAGTTQYLHVATLEDITGDLALHPQALPFVEYRRMVNGIPAGYVCFIWEKSQFPAVKSYAQALPDACIFVNLPHDIMSFYKEEIAGETGTYIHDRAVITGKSRSETLREFIAETPAAAVDRVRTILGEGEARDAWESFVMGYIRFHDSPRYRLRESFVDEYALDVSHY